MSAPAIGIDDAVADLATGHGTVSALAGLTRGMLTVRLILLRTLIAEITARQPEIDEAAGLSDAYQALTELQQSHPAAVEALLAYPHTGVWLSRVLYRVRITSDDKESTPLWADCGYLGWLAAAGAVANLPCGSMRVVVRDGEVMLPGFGMARVGSVDYCGHCEVHWGDGTVRFATEGADPVRVSSAADESDPAWLPLRRVHGGDGEPDVIIDDLDPFRDLHSDPPPRLTTDEAEIWRRDFVNAWQLLRRDFPDYLRPMRNCLQMLAPLTARPVAASTSGTAFNGVGCV
ncbi:hypothetical protein ACFZC5_36405, partial [Nocardia gamkensis]|uniref:hypothetical protein n=1 Tax=Nocardia gamkensis TaxID=352869 RepID=UPI0036E86CF1